MNNRRKLLVAFGAGAFAAPFASFAQQQGKIWRIGFLGEGEQSFYVERLEAFKAGMRALGYAEGRDYSIEHRSAQNNLARLPALVAELLALKVDVIMPAANPSAQAARQATRETPILIVSAGDPVESGLVATLSRPGGNVTGLTNGVGSELFTKRLDLLRQILPGIGRVGFLYNPDNASNALGLKQFESDCSKLKFKSIRAPVRKAQDIASVFETLKLEKAQGLLVTGGSTNNASLESIIQYAAKHRLPAVYTLGIYAESGGLISYGINTLDLYRRAAAYADKIFKGAKPGDLPIEQPIKFEMVVNLKTAKALGIRIPDVVLVRADRVTE